MSNFEVTFYGVRGSIPTPASSEQVQAKLDAALALAKPEDLSTQETRSKFIASLPDHIRGVIGGNSSCVYMNVAGQHLIFDAGSGIRVLGQDLMKQGFGAGQGRGHIFFTHTHWDHIMGLPFFVPLFIKGNKFTIGGCHDRLEERLVNQQLPDHFPIPFSFYSADIDFIDLAKQPVYEPVEGLQITWHEMDHPGKSFAYRVEYQGKVAIFATDAEYKDLSDQGLAPYVEFFKDADVVIFDSQYTMVECLEKEDWGHSTAFIGMEIAKKAKVKKLMFFHHEPNYSDFILNDILVSAREFLDLTSFLNDLQVDLAREGQTLKLL